MSREGVLPLPPALEAPLEERKLVDVLLVDPGLVDALRELAERVPQVYVRHVVARVLGAHHEGPEEEGLRLLTGEVKARALVDAIYMDDKVKDYILDLVMATRDPAAFKLDLAPFIQYGASPRATLYLTLAAKAHAFLQGRGYVTPQDVKSMAPDVLRHRIILSYEAEAEAKSTDDLIHILLERIEVP